MEGTPSRGSSGANATVGDVGSGGLSGLGVQQPQNTPSKRRTVLSISPPPEDLFDDSQMSCQDEPTAPGAAGPDSEQSSNMWADESVSNFSLVSSISYNDNTEVPRKSRKRTPRQRPGPKPAPPEDSMDMFDADSAKAPHYVLSQLGTDKTTSISRYGDTYPESEYLLFGVIPGCHNNIVIFVPLQLSRVRNCSERWVTVCSVPPEE